MQFEWDPVKAEINLRKHGIPFEEAVVLFLDPDRVLVDATRLQDGEDRKKAIGKIGARLFTAVFVMRGPTCRLISARRSNRSEERRYDPYDTGP